MGPQDGRHRRNHGAMAASCRWLDCFREPPFYQLSHNQSPTYRNVTWFPYPLMHTSFFYLFSHLFILLLPTPTKKQFLRLSDDMVTTMTFGNIFLKKWANPGLFFIYFHSFTHITIFTSNKCEKCPFSIRCQDSNSQPLEHESPPITIRPGLPPCLFGNVYVAPLGTLCLLMVLQSSYIFPSHIVCFIIPPHSMTPHWEWNSLA